MAFEKGVISFRMLFPSRVLSEEDAGRFAAAALPPLDTLSEEEMHGWVTGRHLLDRRITKDAVSVGGYFRVTLAQAKKTVPASLLAAECAMEEAAVIEAEGKRFLNRQERQEIRRAVRERLLPEMPPRLRGIDLVCDPRSRLLYASATNEKQLDALVLALLQTAGVSARPADPETLALELEGVDVRDWPPASFSDRVPDEAADAAPGREFLTWLWFVSEERGGREDVPEVGEIAWAVEGPLLFAREGRGAHEILLRNGEPMLGAETRAALLDGKKLRRARLRFARGEEEWQVTLDADAFVFRGLRLPATESYDLVGRFQERMVLLDVFRRLFFHLYRAFLRERSDAARWEKTRAAMRRWAAERPMSEG